MPDRPPVAFDIIAATSTTAPNSAELGTAGLIRIGRAWTIWGVVSIGLAGYAGLALVASHSTGVPIKLKPGERATVSLVRLSEDLLTFDLIFQAPGCQRRPELGEWRPREEAGFLKFAPGTTGAAVHMVASISESNPVEFDALPLVAYCSDSNVRAMSANLPVEPGVYRWPPPPSTPAIHLHPGVNTVQFEVTSVGPPIMGETVQLVVLAPLGFESYRSGLGWLWGGLLWPAFLISQLIWCFGLASKTWLRGGSNGNGAARPSSAQTLEGP